LPGVEAHINRAAILTQGRLLALGSLHSLREEAGLPTLIRANGLKHAGPLQQRWNNAGTSPNAGASKGLKWPRSMAASSGCCANCSMTTNRPTWKSISRLWKIFTATT